MSYFQDDESLDQSAAIFKELDRPLDLADQGLAEFACEVTTTQFEEKRKIILETTLEDLVQLTATSFST